MQLTGHTSTHDASLQHAWVITYVTAVSASGDTDDFSCRVGRAPAGSDTDGARPYLSASRRKPTFSDTCMCAMAPSSTCPRVSSTSNHSTFRTVSWARRIALAIASSTLPLDEDPTTSITRYTWSLIVFPFSVSPQLLANTAGLATLTWHSDGHAVVTVTARHRQRTSGRVHTRGIGGETGRASQGRTNIVPPLLTQPFPEAKLTASASLPWQMMRSPGLPTKACEPGPAKTKDRVPRSTEPSATAFGPTAIAVMRPPDVSPAPTPPPTPAPRVMPPFPARA